MGYEYENDAPTLYRLWYTGRVPWQGQVFSEVKPVRNQRGVSRLELKSSIYALANKTASSYQLRLACQRRSVADLRRLEASTAI
jgi:hypothetical protein